MRKSAMAVSPPHTPPSPPTSTRSSVLKINRKTMIALGVIVIIVVAVAVGVILATRGGGGQNVAGASSLQFSTEITFQGTSTTYTYSAKNIGTSSTMLRIEGTGEEGNFIYIINGAQRQAWVYQNGAWTNLTASFSSTWNQWLSAFSRSKDELRNWSGFGDYTYTDQSSGYTIRIYSIAVNPSFPDSLFEHS